MTGFGSALQGASEIGGCLGCATQQEEKHTYVYVAMATACAIRYPLGTTWHVCMPIEIWEARSLMDPSSPLTRMPGTVCTYMACGTLCRLASPLLSAVSVQVGGRQSTPRCVGQMHMNMAVESLLRLVLRPPCKTLPYIVFVDDLPSRIENVI